MNGQKNNELKKVVENLIRQGITDEDEQVEIICRDHDHLLPAVCVRDAKRYEAESLILEANRESMKAFGRPAMVCLRIDGVMRYKNYDSLTETEITELKQRGVIP